MRDWFTCRNDTSREKYCRGGGRKRRGDKEGEGGGKGGRGMKGEEEEEGGCKGLIEGTEVHDWALTLAMRMLSPSS